MTTQDPAALALQLCTCEGGAYHGAQKVGTPPRCERCGFLPDEPWVLDRLEALLVSVGRLKRDMRNLRPCGCRAGAPTITCCDEDAPTTLRFRWVGDWTTPLGG